MNLIRNFAGVFYIKKRICTSLYRCSERNDRNPPPMREFRENRTSERGSRPRATTVGYDFAIRSHRYFEM